MPAVVPSQIVQFIDNAFRFLKREGSQDLALHQSVCGALNALIRLIDELPSSLLPVDAEAYSQLVLSMESIRFAVQRAVSQEDRAEKDSGPPTLRPGGGGKPSQVWVIRDVLSACPDETLARRSNELAFIKDLAIRDGLLLDLEGIRSALRNGEWKAATVLAGSIVEALRLWALNQKTSTDRQAACAAALEKRTLTDAPPSDILDWGLHQCIEVAAELDLIEADTAKQARLAKDFRNLIHPGRAIKKQTVCDRGTALAASAAAELISRDLARI